MCSYKRQRACSLSTYLETARRQCLQATKSSPELNHIGPLISDFPAYRTMRNKHLLVKPPSVWYFVRAPDLTKIRSQPCQSHIPFMSFVAPRLLERSYVKVFTDSPIRLTSIRARALTALFLPECPASIPVLDTRKVLCKCVGGRHKKEAAARVALTLSNCPQGPHLLY